MDIYTDQLATARFRSFYHRYVDEIRSRLELFQLSDDETERLVQSMFAQHHMMQKDQNEEHCYNELLANSIAAGIFAQKKVESTSEVSLPRVFYSRKKPYVAWEHCMELRKLCLSKLAAEKHKSLLLAFYQDGLCPDAIASKLNLSKKSVIDIIMEHRLRVAGSLLGTWKVIDIEESSDA